ncbi:TetR/AcrR family transcriptional regulator [Pseudoteredinibacter isoporae]|uniref:AcrR family transcriptional regulator n=1 Tax=Pseudoteredinibacter isoporae TaxID=570281 RepID=A0A7X0JTB8_9GAMM|nr:TetR/AcrR family transcriptional regulator [Pseudoteredinibacter isoporae]MBB6521474.1 AcrR family transcriptional regulator [Pseudoteredinibacter isoporae]NHO87028.1 TetR/AcrR family transcriptional regulator [Pseudoteredinibacter isoporae]NIB24519.1 TetR/AcrR family transcriptional regulator [Pseudoteredinibacter isoporae]
MQAKTEDGAPAERSYKGLNTSERQAMRRKQLMQAGIEVMGSRGYAGCSCKMICTQAGLTERYFYQNFANREALLQAIYQEHSERVMEEIASAVADCKGEQPELRIEAGLRAFYGDMRENPNIARILYIETSGVSPEMDDLLGSTTHGFAMMLIEQLRNYYPDKHLDVDDVELVAIGLVGSVNAILVHWLLCNFDKPLDSVLQSASFVFRAVSASLLSKS